MNALKKNWYLFVPILLILLPLLLTLSISAKYGYSMGESWTVLKTYNQAKTKFQDLKFTESRFRKITPGMKGSEVYEILGMPLERHNEDTLWYYSLPVMGATYFHERTLKLQPGTGKVAEVVCRYHTPELK